MAGAVPRALWLVTSDPLPPRLAVAGPRFALPVLTAVGYANRICARIRAFALVKKPEPGDAVTLPVQAQSLSVALLLAVFVPWAMLPVADLAFCLIGAVPRVVAVAL